MSQGMTKASKILQYVNYRMRVTVDDGRQFVGKFMAFDKHMNAVLGDAEEFRRIPVRSATGGKTGEEKEEKRAVGLVVIRGDCVISMTVESKPQAEPKQKIGAGAAGPGQASAAGRGLPVAPMGQAPAGLAGPARGVGGPGANVMNPMGRGGVAAPPMMNRPPGMGPPPGMGAPPGRGGPPPGMPPPGMGPPPGDSHMPPPSPALLFPAHAPSSFPLLRLFHERHSTYIHTYIHKHKC